jgi:hypothetical protein
MSRYEFFRWVHTTNSRVCSILGAESYGEVSSGYHSPKSVLEALAEPDFPWLVTPEGVEAACEWLTEGGGDGVHADMQYQRMLLLFVSPIFMLLGHTLRIRIPALQRNLRYLKQTLGDAVVEPRWMRIRLEGTGKKHYGSADFFKYKPHGDLEKALVETKAVLDRRREHITDAMQKVSNELLERLYALYR